MNRISDSLSINLYFDNSVTELSDRSKLIDAQLGGGIALPQIRIE